MIHDLNIENYSLEDILKLFKLNANYDKHDLLNVKKVLLKYHPDKTSAGLSPDYFIFLKSAYDMLSQLITTKQQLSDDNETISKLVLDDFFKKEKKIDFSVWFNKEFEKIKTEPSRGYEAWLRHDDESNCNKLAKKHDNSFINGAFIDDSEDLCFDSFSNNNTLAYQDLYDAHSQEVSDNSIINDEYEKSIRFTDTYSLRQYRETQDLTPLSDKSSNEIFQKNAILEKENDIRRKFHLLKEEKKHKENQNLFLKTLKNSI